MIGHRTGIRTSVVAASLVHMLVAVTVRTTVPVSPVVYTATLPYIVSLGETIVPLPSPPASHDEAGPVTLQVSSYPSYEELELVIGIVTPTGVRVGCWPRSVSHCIAIAV